jgi:DNA-binding beta-propeller fold protein YncE
MEGDSIAVLDADDMAKGVVRTLDVAGNGASWIAADGARRRLYLANKTRGTLSAFETVTMTELPGSPYQVGQMPVHVAVHKPQNLVLVTNSSSHDFSAFKSATMEQVTGSPITCAGQTPAAIAVDDQTSRVFILNRGGTHDVSVYEVFGPDDWVLRPERLPTESGPVSLVADSPDRRLYIANSSSNNVTAYGMDDLVQIVGSPFPAGNGPSFIDLDPGAGTVYVANTGDDLVTTYNAQTMATTGSITMPAGSGPTSLSVDTPRNRLYVAAGGTDTVNIYALDTNAKVGDPTALPAKPINIDHD